MATICFDIKRVDENYVCIQHCNMNHFEYQYHLPFSFYPREINGKEHWWLNDNKYRYVWIVIGKDSEAEDIEKIIWACNDKRWLNNSLKYFTKNYDHPNSFTKCKDIKIIKLPFEEKVKTDNINFPYRYISTDMQDKFKLYCPMNLNEKYHIYTDHYEEVESEIEAVIEIDEEKQEFKRRKFKWIAPKYLNEEIDDVK